MVLDNLLAGSKTDSRSLHFFSVQSREDSEDAGLVFTRNTDAVVLDGEHEITVSGFGRHVNHWFSFVPILDRISDQILQQLCQPDRIVNDRRQLVMCNARTAV